MKLFQLYPKALAHLTCKSPRLTPLRRTENGKRRTESPCGATDEASVQSVGAEENGTAKTQGTACAAPENRERKTENRERPCGRQASRCTINRRAPARQNLLKSAKSAFSSTGSPACASTPLICSKSVKSAVFSRCVRCVPQSSLYRSVSTNPLSRGAEGGTI